MPNTQTACPYCKSVLSLSDDLAPGTAVPCLVCNRAFVPHPQDEAPKQVVMPASGSRTLVAGGLIFAGLATLMLGGMSVVLWLAFGRQAPAAELDGGPAPQVAQASGPAPVSAPATAVAPSEAVPTPEPDVDLADIKKPAVAPPPSEPIAKPVADIKIPVEIRKPSEPIAKPVERNEPRPPPRMQPAVMQDNRPGVDQRRIDAAIDRGVRFLKGTQLQNGTWLGGPDIGVTALAGLTLLECKVPPTDPSVLKAAGYVRKNAETNTFQHKSETYELSLAILFLDRLGNPKDDPVIQRMALRLLSGQNLAGGWTYHTAHQLTTTESKQLLVFLRSHQPPLMPKILAQPGEIGKQVADALGKLVQEPKPGETPPKQVSGTAHDPKDSKIIKTFEGKEPAPNAPKEPAPKQPKKVAPIPLKNLVKELRSLPVAKLSVTKGNLDLPPVGRGEDNSNTQFALMGLWAARRHGVPVEYSLLFAQERFVKSQNPNDGGWGYHVLHKSKNTMICVGLIGLAMGHGIHVEMGKHEAKKEDAAIQKGLLALSAYIGTPSVSPMPDQPNLYFLWSLERVAMLYDLKTIGGKDWYAWGAEALAANQLPNNGAWANGRYPGANPHCDTCFALLFLKRSNLVADLTENLRMHMIIRDPDAKSGSPAGSSPGKSPNR